MHPRRTAEMCQKPKSKRRATNTLKKRREPWPKILRRHCLSNHRWRDGVDGGSTKRAPPPIGSDKHLDAHQAFDAELDGGLCAVAVDGAEIGVFAGLHEGTALVSEGEKQMAGGTL